MKEQSFNQALFEYLNQLGARPKKSLLKANPHQIIGNFEQYSDDELFEYYIDITHLNPNQQLPDTFFCENIAGHFQFITTRHNKIISCNQVFAPIPLPIF